jgi:hypothetical protein
MWLKWFEMGSKCVARFFSHFASCQNLKTRTMHHLFWFYLKKVKGRQHVIYPLAYLKQKESNHANLTW